MGGGGGHLISLGRSRVNFIVSVSVCGWGFALFKISCLLLPELELMYLSFYFTYLYILI